jgi:HK97 family phage major capsid protein
MHTQNSAGVPLRLMHSKGILMDKPTETPPALADDPTATIVKAIDGLKDKYADRASLDTVTKAVSDLTIKVGELKIGKDNELEDPGLGLFKKASDFLMAVRKSAKGDPAAHKLIHEDYPARLYAAGKIVEKAAYTTADSDIYAPPLMDSEVMRVQADRVGLAARCKQFAVPAPHRVRDILYRMDKDHSTDMGAANGVKVFRASETVSLTSTKGKAPNKLRLEPQKVAAYFQISAEELEMNPRSATEAMQDMDEAFAFAEEEDILWGTGGDKPIGMLATQNPSLITVLRQTANTVVTLDLANMLKRAYGSLSDYVWMGSKALIPQIVSLKHPTADATVFTTSVKGGEAFGALFGIPLLFSDHIVALGTQSDLSLVNTRQYAWATRGGRRQDRSIHVAFLTDLETFRAIEYRDGKPLWNSAMTPKRGDTRSPFITLDNSTT